MVEKSKIYRNDKGKLTKYQEAINNAAYELCLDNASLMNNKRELLNLSRKKIDENGYAYKKKRSRSKEFGSGIVQPEEKKVKVSTEFRQKRIKDISEDIESIKTTITLLEKERFKQHNMKKYAQAASAEEQIASKRKEKRALEEELTKLQEKEMRSYRYHKSKGYRAKKELQKATVQEKNDGQLSLFDSGIKGIHKSNKITVSNKKKENSAGNTESDRDNTVVTSEVEEELSNDENDEKYASGTLTETDSAYSSDRFL